MQSRRSPTRARPSRVPALPPLVAPWQQEETIPNKPHPQPPTHPPPQSSPSNEVSSSSGHHYPGSKWEDEGMNKTRLEKLEMRVTILEQMNCALLEQLAASKTDQEEGEMKEKLARMLSETNSQLEKLEHRVLLNEHSIRSEEARVTTLVKSTQEIEQGILDGQKQLLQRRDDHSACLEGVKESVHQLEQKQLQLGEFAQQVHASFAMEARRLGEGVKKVKNHIENTRESIEGKLKELEHTHRALDERLLVADAAVRGLQNTNVQMKKQIDSWVSGMRNGHSDLHRQLVEMEREKRKQDLQLRESFAQVQAQIQRHSSHLQEWMAGELRKSSEHMVAENDKLNEAIVSVLQYSQRECAKSKESLRTKLEARITSTEESLESEREVCVSRLEELHSAVRRECGEARAELARTSLQQGEKGREVLQGALSVMEKESKASRQEILAVVEAEIKTRDLEVCNLQSQYQKLCQECYSNSQTVRKRLEAMEERTHTDREQLQSVRESLVSEWQAIAAQLLGDFDSRLSAVHIHITNLERNAHPDPPPQKVTDGEQDMEDSKGDFEGCRDVLQWKKEVLQQLSLVQKQQGDESQQIAGLNRALRELQIKLVGAMQRETNQRFHAVLELKNELAQLAAGMPLFPQPPPDHDDSLDTSHVHSRQHMSMVLPHFNEQQLTLGTHQQSCDATSLSGASFFMEQGEGWRGEGEGERDGGREEDDHHCHTQEPTNPLEQPPPTYNMQDSHNPLHSKSQVVLMSHDHHCSDSTNRPTNTTLELPDIAENEAELSSVHTPTQQPGLSESSRVESQSLTPAKSETEREGSKGLDREDNECVLASDGDEHTSNSSPTVSVHERQYYSSASPTPTKLESGELEHAGQELEGEEVESNRGQSETNVVWSIGENN